MADSLAQQFRAQWEQSDQAPDVFGFLDNHPDASAQDKLDVILLDQFKQWRSGKRPAVEDYCQRCPDIASDAELKLELIAADFANALDAREAPDVELVLDRFPEINKETLRERLESLKPDGEESLEDTHSFDQPLDDTGDGHVAKEQVAARELRQTDEMPKTIGRYRVIDVLGTGAFGCVYRAIDDQQLEREVAIKVPHRERVKTPADIKHYLKEARILASLDHAGIVPVYDSGETEDGLCFVVSKLIHGQNLETLINSARPDPARSAELVADVAEALHHAHSKKLIHRDIKPANLLLDQEGRIYVADFGLALKEEDYGNLSNQGGTPAYMSPEQARCEGHLVDGRSDIFSLGVVFYELLTGSRPFVGKTVPELLERIAYSDARPPRQRDDTIPEELERICLKALSNRKSERYTTARDMACDLKEFLATAKEEVAETPIKVVPKGLRSFDARDSDFILELLPGPTDRDGLPESIRFWKNRIETADTDNTFRVGLIYGPSGCGKTSLVNAGLLPRLARNVVCVSVVASRDHTEDELRRQLLKCCPELSDDLKITQMIARLRQGDLIPGAKVLIVLDQFEQWLHADPSLRDAELVDALRQCDGGNVQCLILVRDDFWSAISRFMEALEIDLVQRQNMMLVDLFDRLHARKVLTEFGRSFGRLPENLDELTDAQSAFLEQAVLELSSQGTVVAVQLAVLADMIKGLPWTPDTLEELQGIEGVGVRFLDLTFSERSAPPTHRRYEPAVRSILKVLLPEPGAEIKGQMKSRQQLEEACEPKWRDSIDAVIKILDPETRLITPTERPQGEAHEAVASETAAQTYYQLTHDFLVKPLREWLNRKLRETRRGRAELRLEERSSLWNAKPENRHLPSMWEWCNIRLLARRRRWTEPERKMMRRAGRYHSIRASILSVLLILLGWVGYETYGHFQVEALMSADANKIPVVLGRLPSSAFWAGSRLRSLAADDTKADQRLRARIALVTWGGDNTYVKEMVDALFKAEPAYVGSIRNALKTHQVSVARLLEETLSNSAGDASQRFRAGLALAVFDEPEHKWRKQDLELLARQLVASNPVHLTYLMDYLQQPLRVRLLPYLEPLLSEPSLPQNQQINVASVLAEYGKPDPQSLARSLCQASVEQYEILYPVLDNMQDAAALAVLQDKMKEEPQPAMLQKDRLAHGKQRAGAAITLLRLDEREAIFDALRVKDDPEALTQFVHRCRERKVSAKSLVECLDVADRLRQTKTIKADRTVEDRVLFGLLLALGEYPPSELQGDQERIIAQVGDWYTTDPSSAIHGACGWLLRTWGREDLVRKVDETPVPYSQDREWYTLAVEHQPDDVSGISAKIQTFYLTFVVFPAGKYVLGSPEDEDDHQSDEGVYAVQIKQPFAILNREIRRVEAEAYMDGIEGYQDRSKTLQHPVAGRSWYDAVRFCRWLTTLHLGDNEDNQAYPDPASFDNQQRDPRDDGRGDRYRAPLNWRVDLDKPGFRLPMEAEWEVACRGGMRSTFGFGHDVDLLNHYGWFGDNSNGQAYVPGSLRPNLRGLFDMHGNMYEWCHNWYGSERTDDIAGPLTGEVGSFRVYRGGGWGNSAGFCRSSYRDWDVPTDRYYFLGFRVAKVPSSQPSKKPVSGAESGSR